MSAAKAVRNNDRLRALLPRLDGCSPRIDELERRIVSANDIRR